MCHVLCVVCHASCVTCHIIRVTCHISLYVLVCKIWVIGEAFEESVELAPDTQDAAADVPALGKEAAQKAPAVEVGEEIVVEDELEGTAEKRKIG